MNLPKTYLIKAVLIVSSAFLLALLIGAPAAQPVEGVTRRIPFQMQNGLIWVDVEADIVGKKGRTRVCHFVLDSGAGATVINPDIARRLKLKAGEALPLRGAGVQGTTYRLEGFRASAGGVPLSGEEVYLVAFRRSRGEKNRRIDGMLGQDFFRGRVVQINYAEHSLLVSPTPPRYGPGAVKLPIRLHKDAMLVPIAVNQGKQEWVRLDTGCVSALEWGGGGVAPEGSGKKGGGNTAHATVTLGREQLQNLPIGLHSAPFFSGEAGLLGNGLLSRYRKVTIDGNALQLVLEP